MIQQHDPRYTFPQQHEALTLQEMIPKWKAAKKALKECQMQAHEMWYCSYEDMLVQYKLDRSPESIRRAKIVQRTISTERCRETYRSIRNSTKPFCEHTGGIKNILIPAVSQEGNRTFNPEASETYEWLTQHPEGPQRWDRLIEREEVERYLLHYNRDSFRAASASPCGHGKILNSLSFTSLSDTGHTKLLHGNIPEAWYGQNELLKEFLRSFSSPDPGSHFKPIATGVSVEEVKRGFGKWREAMSTSPQAVISVTIRQSYFTTHCWNVSPNFLTLFSDGGSLLLDGITPSTLCSKKTKVAQP